MLHDESDLRHRLEVNGWADVLLMGLDQDVLGSLSRSSRTRTAAGLQFVGYTTERKDASAVEVWFNQEQALPSAFILNTIAGVTRLSVERLRVGVDAALLRVPAVRFPRKGR